MLTTRVLFPLLVAGPLALAAAARAIELDRQVILAPPAGADLAPWRAELRAWRDATHARIRYDGSEYARPELQWAQRDFVQPQMMVEDRYFYDPASGRYTVDRYLDDLEARYGGIDSVLIWPIYPNVGIDDRHQLDLLRDLPGGLDGVRGMVADFHRRGVRVFFPVMPWDTGGRPYAKPLPDELAEAMAYVGADGVNADAILGIPREYRDAADRAGAPLVFQSESGVADDFKMLEWHNQTWGYWPYRPAPVVSVYKWLEPRHMVNVCERWARDRTDGLQSAFFNGVGYETWENVWGIWNGITPRDAEAVRRIATIYRAVAPLLVASDWEPHTPSLQRDRQVFASAFPGDGQTLWTFVNRGPLAVEGPQLAVPAASGTRYYDLWSGRELGVLGEPGAAYVAFHIEPWGFGAVLAVEDGATPDYLAPLLARMTALSQRALSTYSDTWEALPQRLVEIPPTAPAAAAPAGMIAVPAARYPFKVSGVEIEGGDEPGVDVQYPWEALPRRHHAETLAVRAFYIDRYPVTNAAFKRFLDASGYAPRDPHNFLKHWVDGRIPAGWENKPVTWVALEDARAYATWAGKRLPHEWEWQYAAQGLDGRIYPWGDEWSVAAVPPPSEGGPLRAPTDVDAYPLGASPFGVMDMTGNVWQWTDEYVDERTRAAIVRGGGYYRPSASMWYFPRNTRLDEHGKYLLMAPAKDRSGMIGFRCVVDAAAEAIF